MDILCFDGKLEWHLRYVKEYPIFKGNFVHKVLNIEALYRQFIRQYITLILKIK